MGGLSQLLDGFGRPITYMRISVTDKCNLRCIYCMPEEGVKPRKHAEMLGIEEFARVARIAAGLGISKIRITGGEPLVRKGIVELVSAVSAIPEIRDVSMTTNAVLLEPIAHDLAKAGLTRVNISLDSLRAETYAKITRRGSLSSAFAGIAAAERAGLLPIRLNTVVLSGINLGEIESLAALTVEHPWDVRFIEFMPFWGNGGVYGQEHVVPIDEIRRRVLALGAMPVQQTEDFGSGPAAYVQIPGALGKVGFISRNGYEFCNRCNRIRLTADGHFRPCLLSESMIDAKEALRGDTCDEAIADIIRQAVSAKPESGATFGGQWTARPLSDIGG